MRFILFLFLSSLTFANESLLSKYLGAFNTFESQFSQVTTDSDGNTKQKTSGFVKIKKPNFFYWITRPPFNQELISDGKTVWFYDEDLEQVTLQSFDTQLSNAPLALLSGDPKKISQNFTVNLKSNKFSKEFVLLSKNKSFGFSEVRLFFNEGILQDMQLLDNTGQKTKILFFDVQVNNDIDDKFFTFNIPEGIDVIRK